MGDILDGNDKFAAARAKSKAAAEEWLRDFRKFEHCEDPYGPRGLYLWPNEMRRPSNLPIDAREFEICFDRYELTFEEAAEVLRVGELRLEAELLNDSTWRKLAQQRDRRYEEERKRLEEKAKQSAIELAKSIVSVIYVKHHETLIKITRPKYPHGRPQLLLDADGNYIVKITSNKKDDILDMAEEIIRTTE